MPTAIFLYTERAVPLPLLNRVKYAATELYVYCTPAGTNITVDRSHPPCRHAVTIHQNGHRGLHSTNRTDTRIRSHAVQTNRCHKVGAKAARGRECGGWGGGRCTYILCRRGHCAVHPGTDCQSGRRCRVAACHGGRGCMNVHTCLVCDIGGHTVPARLRLRYVDTM